MTKTAIKKKPKKQKRKIDVTYSVDPIQTRFRGRNRGPKVTREHTLARMRENAKKWRANRVNMTDAQKKRYERQRLRIKHLKSIDELINDVNDMHRRAENTQLNAEELKKENE